MEHAIRLDNILTQRYVNVQDVCIIQKNEEDNVQETNTLLSKQIVSSTLISKFINYLHPEKFIFTFKNGIKIRSDSKLKKLTFNPTDRIECIFKYSNNKFLYKNYIYDYKDGIFTYCFNNSTTSFKLSSIIKNQIVDMLNEINKSSLLIEYKEFLIKFINSYVICCIIPYKTEFDRESKYETYIFKYSKKDQNARGSITWNDGIKFTGNWIHSNPNNRTGITTYSSGTIEEGEWKDGKFIKGTKTYASGTIEEGDWIDNIFKGTTKFSNGDYMKGVIGSEGFIGKGKLNGYEGEFKNGHLIKGVKKCENNDIIEGSWENNELHGLCIYNYADGTILKGYWIHGKFATKY